MLPSDGVEEREKRCRRLYELATAERNLQRTTATRENEPRPTQKRGADDHKDAQEYCVQRRAAEAAERQADYSLLGLLLSFLALGGVLGTLVYTARAANAAAEAAEHTARSVEVEIRFQQPLLFVNKITSFVQPPDWQQVEIFVKNYGKTPAVIIERSLQCRALDELPARPTYDKIVKFRGVVLRPDDQPEDYKVELTEADAEVITNNSKKAFLWGYIKYEDALGRTRIRAFAFSSEPYIAEDGFPVPGSFGLTWTRAGGPAYNYDCSEVEI